MNFNNWRNSLKTIKFEIQRSMLEEKFKGTHTKLGTVRLCSSNEGGRWEGGCCGSKSEREEILL